MSLSSRSASQPLVPPSWLFCLHWLSFFLSVCISVCQFVCLSICLLVCQSVTLPFVRPFRPPPPLWPSTPPPPPLRITMSICLSICLSTRQLIIFTFVALHQRPALFSVISNSFYSAFPPLSSTMYSVSFFYLFSTFSFFCPCL